MWKMLKHIGQTHRRKLITTFSLVGLDNLLLLIYPVFGGWAINAVMEGNVWQAMLYGVVVLLMWLVGAARRIADTRTFTKIYTEIAVPVVLEQRKREVPHSAITARVALSREFVSFFEEHLPIAATSLVSIFGACYDVTDIGILGGRIGCRDTCPVFMVAAAFCRHQRKPIFPFEQPA